MQFTFVATPRRGAGLPTSGSLSGAFIPILPRPVGRTKTNGTIGIPTRRVFVKERNERGWKAMSVRACPQTVPNHNERPLALLRVNIIRTDIVQNNMLKCVSNYVKTRIVFYVACDVDTTFALPISQTFQSIDFRRWVSHFFFFCFKIPQRRHRCILEFSRVDLNSSSNTSNNRAHKMVFFFLFVRKWIWIFDRW